MAGQAAWAPRVRSRLCRAIWLDGPSAAARWCCFPWAPRSPGNAMRGCFLGKRSPAGATARGPLSRQGAGQREQVSEPGFRARMGREIR
jgi:hypothetical protein